MPISHPENLEPYLKRLRELPFVEAVSLGDGAPAGVRLSDAVVELQLVDGTTTLVVVEVKASHLGSNAQHHLGARSGPGDLSRLVAAPHVGAPLGDQLMQREVNYIDRQGNCYLRIDERFVARIQGRTPPKAPARTKEMRAPGYQVMFALLAAPDLVAASQREIAAAAGTSRQPVAALLERFVEERILVRRRKKHAWVDEPNAALMARWLAGYVSTLRPKLLVGRFRLPAREPKALEKWLDARLETTKYGGTAGAYRLDPHYRGPLTVVHLGEPSEELRRTIRAAPAQDGELVWMRHIGDASRRGATADTAHPLLMYAELASDPDPRAGEVAELLRAKWLPWSL